MIGGKEQQPGAFMKDEEEEKFQIHEKSSTGGSLTTSPSDLDKNKSKGNKYKQF